MRKWAVIAIAISIALGIGFINNQVRNDSILHIKQNNIASYVLGLAVSLLVLIGSLSLGWLMLGNGFQKQDRLILSTSLGLALLSLLILIIGAIGILSMASVLVALIVFVVIGFRKSLVRSQLSIKALPLTPLEAAFVSTIGFALLVCLVNTLSPITANDALVYHLSIPKIYAAKARIARLPFNVYANMPHCGELLYTACFVLGGEVAARLFYFLTLLITCLAIYRICKSISTRFSAIVATSSFVVGPLLIDPRVICNVDVFLALVSMACIDLILDQDNQGRWKTIVIGLLCGFAISIKYTGLGLVLAILITYSIKSGMRRAVLSGVVAIAVFSPWLIKNYLFVGNPFFPMFEGWFDGLNWDRIQLEQLLKWQRSMGMQKSALGYLLLPINVFIAGRPGLNYTRFDGTVTPALLFLTVLSLFKPKKTILIPPLITFIFWAVTSQQMRFLVPTLAMLTIPAAFGVEYLRQKCSQNGFAIVISVLFIIQVASLILPDQYGNPVVSNALCDRLPVVMGLETKNHFLQRSLQPFEIFSYINGNLAKDKKIFMIWENRGYYLDREYLSDSFFEASTVMRWAEQTKTAEALAERIRANGFDYVLVNNTLGQVFARLYPAQSVRILIDMINNLKPLHSANNITLYEFAEKPPTGYNQEP